MMLARTLLQSLVMTALLPLNAEVSNRILAPQHIDVETYGPGNQALTAGKVLLMSKNQVCRLILYPNTDLRLEWSTSQGWIKYWSSYGSSLPSGNAQKYGHECYFAMGNGLIRVCTYRPAAPQEDPYCWFSREYPNLTGLELADDGVLYAMTTGPRIEVARRP